MNKIVSLATVAICVCTVHAGPPESGSVSNWFQNDTTGRLEEVIIDFRLNYEDLCQQRRAFVVKGEWFSRSRRDVKFSEVYFVTVIDGPGKELYGNSRTRPWLGHQRQLEYWEQVLIDGGKTYRRWSPYHAVQTPEELGDSEKAKLAKSRFVRFDPVAMSISGVGFARTHGPSREADVFLTNGILQSAKYNDDGDIVQETKFSDGPVEGTIVYGKKHGFFPTSFSIWIRGTDGRRLHSRVETEWQVVAGLRVPKTLEMVKPHRAGQIESYSLKVDVRVGEQLKGIKLVELDAGDWRETTRKLFKEDWQRAGTPVPILLPNK